MHDVLLELTDIRRTTEARQRYIHEHQAEADRAKLVQDLINEKIVQAVQDWSVNPPDFLIQAIGRPRVDPRALEGWQHNARVIVTWRMDNSITGPEPFGLNHGGHPADPPSALRLQLRVEPVARPIDRPDLAIGL